MPITSNVIFRLSTLTFFNPKSANKLMHILTAFYTKLLQGEQGDCAVRSLTCESEPLTQEKVSIERVSTAFSQKSCQTRLT